MGTEIASDLPPKSVVVVESCSVSLSGRSYPGATSASASNGLDARFCTNDSGSGPIPGPRGGTIGTTAFANDAGTAAKIMQGGDEVPVTCSPSGSCSAANGPFDVRVSYSVDVKPVTVSVAGTVFQPDTGDNILIGQRATGELGCGVPGVSFTGHSWTVGGALYRNWAMASDQSGATGVDVPADEWTKVKPSWQWRSSNSGDSQGECDRAPRSAIFGGISIGSATGQRDVRVFGSRTRHLTASMSRLRHGAMVTL